MSVSVSLGVWPGILKDLTALDTGYRRMARNPRKRLQTGAERADSWPVGSIKSATSARPLFDKAVFRQA